MILLIDNYDSFTYNLYQQISMLGKEVKVIRNDAITISEIVELNPMAIIISPGPGTPADAGISIEIIRKLYKQYPILGICLGHQSIGAAFGAKIVQAKTIMHGKISTLSYKNHALFESFNEPISVMRYHSLVIEEKSLTNQLEVIARAEDDNEIMAIKHVIYPLYGLQFHPESIGTKQGSRMMQSFIESLEISNVK
ncbi:anthranilate synthase component II [Psychrobacillus psychrodurans]|uniref:anthranilate synthase component II n=1 Tax=Psychrobacillus psychrodurans TaxID=126157 RepID=UPI0008EF4EF3|nr:aminodeoxychorismate/anthranilate synthase component II [Psychrobacillus psychrodurans]MCZ8541613.1 aminodeoxychorismate/anthranilate synthase component II [Psychrobacillus psychrodurans]SFN06393.1 anthranilate synthase component 2/anthranilate synthase/phosphoribosyltransferase [Psychrobacillus psychrodurans]